LLRVNYRRSPTIQQQCSTSGIPLKLRAIPFDRVVRLVVHDKYLKQASKTGIAGHADEIRSSTRSVLSKVAAGLEKE
jgi:hypothetical protein